MTRAELADLDPDEYEVIVDWMRDAIEAHNAAVSGDGEPSINMDEPNWRDKLR